MNIGTGSTLNSIGHRKRAPRRAILRPAVTIVMLTLIVGDLKHSAAATVNAVRDPRRVEILYSADDALCRPLGRLYDRLNHEHPGDYDWEDRYPSQFASIGLRQPKPLNDSTHPFRAEPRRAYYRLRFAGDIHVRLVYVEDFLFSSHTRDNYQSNIWIFKPGRDVSQGEFFSTGWFGGLGMDFRASAIDLAILFHLTPDYPDDYRRIDLPYYFLKIATQKQKAAIEAARNGKVVIMPAITPGTAYILQRPFLFGTNIVVLVHGAGMFLVYQIKKGWMDDVCYFATSNEIYSLRAQGWTSKGSKQ